MSGDTLTPSGAGGTWEGILWFNETVKPNFDHITVEYSIASEKETEKPPSLIWALGRKVDEGVFQTIGQLWIPEFSERDGQKYLQLAGFSKIEDYENGQLVRQSPIQLPDGVATKQTDSLTVKSMEITGSKLLTQFTYKYLWNKAGQANPFPFTEDITFPFSDLKNSNENLNLGIGTYVGYKIKIVRLEVCY